MKAKVTWVIFLLMALSLAADSKNCCGKKMQHSFAAARAGESLPAAATTHSMEDELEAPGILPIKLFIFQFR